MPIESTSRRSATTSLSDLVAAPRLACALSPADAIEKLHELEADLVRRQQLRDTLLIRAAGAAGPAPAEALPLPALLTIRDAAARINVPPSRIKDAVRSGALRSQTVGRYRRIRPEWLEAFVQAEDEKT